MALVLIIIAIAVGLVSLGGGITSLGVTTPIASTGGTAPTLSITPCSDGETYTFDSGSSTWTCGNAGHTIQDEAISLATEPTLNFTGAGVVCADNPGNTRTDCTITGVAGSGVQLDLGNDDVIESTGITEINVDNDTNSIFTETPADQLLIDASLNWPISDDVSCTDCLNATEIEDIYVLIAGDTVTGNIDFNDGVGESPRVAFFPQTGTVWDIYAEDATDDLQLEVTTAVAEGLDIVNTGAGTVVLSIDSLATGGASECVEADTSGVLGVTGAGCGGTPGDSIEVEDGDNTGTFSTIDTTARFEDSADINFSLVDGGAGGPDDITGTVRANAVALATDTTGAYVATIVDSGNTTITVAGSGAENAAVTLDAIDLNCTDCIGATEIVDIYVLVAGDTMTGNLDMDDGTTDSPRILFTPQTGTIWDIYAEDATDDLQIEVTSAVTENLDVINTGAGTIVLTLDSLATGGASECVQTDTNGVLSNTGGACGGGSIDLQGAYNNEVAPALITETNAIGGIIFEGDAELTDPTLTIRDDAGTVGILIDNDDEGGNEASPPLRIANSTAAAGDTQFSFIVTATSEFEIRGDDDAADLTIEADGDLDLANDLTCSGCVDLGPDSTGAYVATVVDSGNSTIAVVGSGGETAAVTLDAIALNCTNCLNADEIADIYVLVVGDVISGNLDFSDGTGESPRVLFTPQTGTIWDIYAEDTGDDLQIEVTTGVAENLDIVNTGAGTIVLTLDSLATGGASECVQTDTNGVFSNTGGACGGSSIDLQGAYDNEVAPALITQTDAIGGIIFEGDAEVTDPNLTLRDSTANKVGLLLDNDDEAGAEASPALRLANSTVAAGDDQFSIVVSSIGELEFQGDDNVADITIEADGDLDLAANLTCTNCIDLGGESVGAYIATIADAGNSNITVTGSGGETAAVTLDVVDVTCTDCLNATEIEDIYLLNSGDATTGDIDFNDGVTASPKATFTPATGTAWDFFVEDTADDLQIEVTTAVSEGLDIINTGAGDVLVTIDSLGTGGAAECVQSNTNGLLSNTGAGCGGGSAIVLDLGDDGGDDSLDLSEIATTGDTNSIFTESAADKLLIAVGNDWPKADVADDLICTNCIGETEISDVYVLIAGDVITGNLDFDDGTTDSPRVLFRPQTGTLWNLYAEDTGDDLQVEVNTASAETVDFVNVGAGTVNINIDGTYTGTNVTSGANPGHTHTGTSISVLDISDDTNLTCGTNCTLTDDEISVDDVFVLVAGDVIAGDLDFSDGVGDSPRVLFRVQTGTLWNIYSEDTTDDLQIEVNTGVTEVIDITNIGAGAIDLILDGAFTAGDITITGSGNFSCTDCVSTGELGVDSVNTANLDDGADSPGAGECLVVAADTDDIEYIACSAGGDITDVGPGYATGAAFTDTVVSIGTEMLVWEGTASDANELTLAAPANPTVDQLFTWPDDQLADDDLIIASGAGTFEYKATPDCDTTNISRLQYDTTTNLFTCDTDPVAAGEYAAASIDGDDVNTNIAGRSLTLTAASPDTLDADVELYTDTAGIWFEDPTAVDDFESIWVVNGFAVTITKIWCESDQTVNMDLQIDDGTPADVNGADLVCDSTPALDESMGGDDTMADGDRLDLAITSVSGTPTFVSIMWTYTKDD